MSLVTGSTTPRRYTPEVLEVSAKTRRLLSEQKYGPRSHRKVLHTGKTYALRDQQFQYMNAQREDFRNSGDPRIRGCESIQSRRIGLIHNL